MRMNSHDESMEIAAFFSKYTLTQIDPETTVVESPNGVYLSKSIQLNREQADIDDVIESLQQHQTLNQNYLLTLISYQLVKSKNQSLTVNTLYQYAKLSMQQQIAQRKQNNQYFTEEELWAIVYSLTKSLQYLQSLGIAYGVLGCDKIFIDKKVKLLDPSAVGEDPFAIAPHRLYSPQILNQHCSPDILKSDVYVLGLCIMQAGLLLPHESLATGSYDESRIKLYMQQFQSMYAAELTSLVAQMLDYTPQNRPNFTQIIEYLENNLEMTDYSQDCFDPLSPDTEDLPNQIELNAVTEEQEVYDGQEEEQQCCLMASLNEFQKARMRFLNEESPSNLKEVSRIEENSRYSSSIRLESSQVKPDRRSLLSRNEQQSITRKQTSKSIKDRVIKDINSLQLEVTLLKQLKKQNEGVGVQNVPHNNDYSHIFTSPKLMQEIQLSLKNIALSRGVCKQNVYHGNY